MSDYSFMKTGLIESSNNNLDNDFINNIQSIVLSFMEKAIKTCEIYVEHSNRNTITPEDIKLGLMLETFVYINRNDTLENQLKWKNIIEGNSSEEEEHIETEENLEIKEEVFKKSTCKCPICEAMNNIEEKWNNWTPESDFEIILKKAIYNTFPK